MLNDMLNMLGSFKLETFRSFWSVRKTMFVKVDILSLSFLICNIGAIIGGSWDD